MDEYTYKLILLFAAIAGACNPYVISLIKRKIFNAKSIRISFTEKFVNESKGEPFIEILPLNEVDKQIVLPYVTSELNIKNNGNPDIYLEEVEIQFQSLAARMETNKHIYPDASLKLKTGDNLNLKYSFDLREADVYYSLIDCKIRFKITELSGRVFYSKFFKPIIEFNNIEL